MDSKLVRNTLAAVTILCADLVRENAINLLERQAF
jgi:hypothetical protein